VIAKPVRAIPLLELETFCNQFDGEYPRRILEAVFRVLTEWSPRTGHVIDAQDGISDVYGMADEDFDRVARALIKECGGCEPSRRRTTREPVVGSITDLVDLVASFCA
jgi:hypothetical protein